jgi:ribosome-associated protein
MTEIYYQKGKGEPLNDEQISKTERKRQMTALQDLGEVLADLSKERLAQVPMSEYLRDAIKEYKRLSANEARRRQMQYIGKIMRGEDIEPIQEKIKQFHGSSAAETAKLHLIERLRNQLIEKDDAITMFLEKYPHADVQQIRTLVRNTRKEFELKKPPKSFRELFQAIKLVLENQIVNDDQNDDEFDDED